MLKNKCCLYVIISIRFFSITICNLLIEFPSYHPHVCLERYSGISKCQNRDSWTEGRNLKAGLCVRRRHARKVYSDIWC